MVDVFVYLLAKVIKNCVKDKDGPSEAHNGQRLPREQPVKHPDHKAGHERFDGRYPVLRCISEQSSEGDEGGEAGEVDEDHGSKALEGKGVLDVGPVERYLPFDVIDQASKGSTYDEVR